MKSRYYVLILILPLLSFCSVPPRSQQEVVVRFPMDPGSLNPVNYGNVYALQVVNLLYQSLLTVDLEDEKIKPLLVTALPEVNHLDSLTYFTFELRPEAVWDNQSPVTAYDVALSLKILKCPLLNNDLIGPRFNFVQGFIVDQTNSRKFTVVCKGYSEEMDLLIGDFFVLPGYLLDPDSLLHPFSVNDFATKRYSLSQEPLIQKYALFFNSNRFTRDKEFLKGSGGYVIEDWKSGQYLNLKKKENWWGDRFKGKLPYLTALPQHINYQVIPDNSTALQILQKGQLDVVEEIPARQFLELKADSSFCRHYQLFTPETYDFSFAGINSRLEKFADKRTRQAIAHLLDVENIIRVTQADFAAKTIGPIHPVNTAFYNASIPFYEPDKAAAEALLRQAGWLRQGGKWQKLVNGQPLLLTINLYFKAGNTAFENAALIFQQSAAAVGIPVFIQPLEGSLLSQKLRSHDFEMVFRSISGNPFSFDFKPALHTDNAVINGANITGFGTAESDAILEAINRTRDKKEKAFLLKRLQEILNEECTLIFLYFHKNRIAVSNRFTNLKISGIKPGYDVSAFAPKP